RYQQAKLQLFKLTARNSRGLQIGIVNADDSSWHVFAKAVPHAITYGLTGGDLRAENISSNLSGSDFDIKHQEMKLHVQTSLPGTFNVSNILAATATAVAVGLSDSQIIKGIAALKGVEGRLAL